MSFRLLTLTAPIFGLLTHVCASAACVQIRTAEELQAINSNLSGRYCLANDIDATGTSAWNNGTGFVPIGASSGFNGIFDGQNHVINGLTEKLNGAVASLGLFAGIGPTGVVKNVGLINVTFELSNIGPDMSDAFGIGGVAGGNQGSIANSFATGTITVSGTSHFAFGDIGGIVGALNDNGSVQDSHAYMSITSTGLAVTIGGLVGGMNSNGTGVRRSYAVSNLTAIKSFSEVGGLVGLLLNGTIDQSFSAGLATSSGLATLAQGGLVATDSPLGSLGNTIRRSYATTMIRSNAGAAGGLIGLNHTTPITQTYAVGNLPARNDVGGLIGDEDKGAITKSYWDVETTSQSQSSGSSARAGLSTSQMKSGLPTGFDSDSWGIAPNSSYPYLRFLADDLHVVTGGNVFLPIGQRDSAQYTNSVLPTFASEACKAAVYAMVARAIGMNFPNRTSSARSTDLLQMVPIDRFWKNDDVGAFLGPLRGLVAAGALTRIAVNEAISDANITGFLKQGIPVAIHGSVSGAESEHWMLATDFLADTSGQVTVLFANDPWTGGRVQIDPVSKKIVSGPPGFLTTFRLNKYQAINITAQ